MGFIEYSIEILTKTNYLSFRGSIIDGHNFIQYEYCSFKSNFEDIRHVCQPEDTLLPNNERLPVHLHFLVSQRLLNIILRIEDFPNPDLPIKRTFFFGFLRLSVLDSLLNIILRIEDFPDPDLPIKRTFFFFGFLRLSILNLLLQLLELSFRRSHSDRKGLTLS